MCKMCKGGDRLLLKVNDTVPRERAALEENYPVFSRESQLTQDLLESEFLVDLDGW